MRKASLSLAAAALAMASSAFAAERTLTGPEIQEFLPTIGARGGNSYQTFDASGHTDYLSGGLPSEGRWVVRGDQYCSVWPPSDFWACYTVAINEEGKLIFWVDANGAREKNRYEPRN